MAGFKNGNFEIYFYPLNLLIIAGFKILLNRREQFLVFGFN